MQHNMVSTQYDVYTYLQYNTMSSTHCVHVSAAHFHNGFFGHGDAAILKPHMWRHEQTICQIRCKVKQLELGQEKKHFAYICTIEQLSEMSSVLFSIFLEGLEQFLKY